MKDLPMKLCILLLVGILISPALADIPVEGMKQYNYQYVINNTGVFPDYLFLTSSEIWNFEHPSIVVNGTFGGGYKLDGFVLHAMKESSLDPRIKEQMETEETKTDLRTYFASAPIVTSELMLPVATSIDDTIPLSNLTILLQIQNITSSELNITKMKTIFGFENGTTIEEAYQEETDDTQPGTPGN